MGVGEIGTREGGRRKEERIFLVFFRGREGRKGRRRKK